MMPFKLALFAILALAFTAESAFATLGTPSVPLPIIVQQRLNSSALTGPIVRLGTQVTEKKVNVLKAVYDFAILGGASGSSIVLKDSDGGDAVLPKNAIIKSVVFSTPTTLVSSNTYGTATLAFGIESASTDMKAATEYTSYNSSNKLLVGIQVPGTVSTWTRVSDYNKSVGVKIGSSAITAGKVVVYIEYYIGAPNE